MKNKYLFATLSDDIYYWYYAFDSMNENDYQLIDHETLFNDLLKNCDDYKKLEETKNKRLSFVYFYDTREIKHVKPINKINVLNLFNDENNFATNCNYNFTNFEKANIRGL